MGSTLNQPAFQQLIDENREWLGRQPRSLERDHIDLILILIREIPPRRLETLHEEFPPSKDHPLLPFHHHRDHPAAEVSAPAKVRTVCNTCGRRGTDGMVGRSCTSCNGGVWVEDSPPLRDELPDIDVLGENMPT